MRVWIFLLVVSAVHVHAKNEWLQQGINTVIKEQLELLEQLFPGITKDTKSRINTVIKEQLELLEQLFPGITKDTKSSSIATLCDFGICFPRDVNGCNCGGANPADLPFEVDNEEIIKKPSISSESAGDGEKEQMKLIFVKSVMEGLGEIPVVGTLAKLLSPFVDSALGREDSEIIRNGFQQVEKLADRLMQNLHDVFKETPPTNLTKATFLKQCDGSDNDPYQNLMVMNTQIKNALRLNFEKDLYYSRTEMERMKKRLYSTLHQLTIVFLFQQRFLNLEEVEKKKNFEKFERKMEEIRTEANKILVELKEPKYWNNLQTFVTNVMSDVATSDFTTRSNHIRKYLFDIYTDDRFCVVTYNRKKSGTQRSFFEKIMGFYPMINLVTPVAIAHSENSYESHEHRIMIIRSKLAHNMSQKDESKFKENVYKIYSDTLREPFAQDKRISQQNPPFSAIVKMSQEEGVTIACSKGLTYSFDVVCPLWVTLEGVRFHGPHGESTGDCYAIVLPP